MNMAAVRAGVLNIIKFFIEKKKRKIMYFFI